MTIGLASLVVLLGIVDVHLPYVVTFIRRLGVWPVYRVRGLRLAITLLNVLLSVIVFVSTPGPGAVILAVIGLIITALAYVLTFEHIFIVLDNPPHVPPEQVALLETEMVIGITIADQAVAWPITQMLLPRHIIHDEVGGQPLLVSYCAACRSALIFDSRHESQRLHFEVAGIWRRNMLMRDRETGTIWQQATGEALMGPVRGKKLPLLGGHIATLAGWKKIHPETLIAMNPRTEQRRSILPRRLLNRLLTIIPERYYTPGLTTVRQADIKPHDTVAGIQIDAVSRAYPLARLRQQPTITEQISGQTITIQYDKAADAVTALINNAPVIVDRQWWFGWKEFHPDSTLYEGERPAV